MPRTRPRAYLSSDGLNRRARDANRTAGALPSAPRPVRVEALCERVVAGEAPVCDRQLTPTTHAELLPQDVAMRLDRPGGDAEPLRDFVVGATGGDEDDHIALPGRDRRDPLDR